MITAFLRTVILYLLIMAGLRLLGKRQIGELEPIELVLTLMLSDLASVPMQDFGIPLLAGVIPICTLLSLSLLASQLSLYSLKFRKLICGTPSILIFEGEIRQDALRKNRYTLDELMEQLREQGYCGFSGIKYAILETSGQLSILPWDNNAPLTPSQARIDTGRGPFLPTVIINDGVILQENLQYAGKDTPWLDKTLSANGAAGAEEIFLLTVDSRDQVTCIRKESS